MATWDFLLETASAPGTWVFTYSLRLDYSSWPGTGLLFNCEDRETFGSTVCWPSHWPSTVAASVGGTVLARKKKTATPGRPILGIGTESSFSQLD